MIKVAHSVPQWLTQTMTWLYNQVRYLPSEIENHIFCEKTANLDQFNLPNINSLWDESKIHYFWDKTLRRINFKNSLGFLDKKIQQQDCQILHSHFGFVGWQNMTIAKKAKLKHIVSFYGLDVNYLPQQNPRWRERYQKLFQEVDRVLCEGNHMAQCIVNLGCPKEKVTVHHLGVQVDKIQFTPRTWSPNQPLKVLIAGSFVEKKGIPYAIEALGMVRNDLPIEITIIGDAPRGRISAIKEKESIEQKIKANNLESKTRLLGYQTHQVFFEEAYKHHIFMSPSVTATDGDTEGGAPVAIIEMAATGIPIISTTHCDIPEIVKHPTTGLLSEEKDVMGLAKSLKLLSKNPESWDSMVKLGRKHIELEYNIYYQAARLAKIYHDLI